jgi:CDGSH-type Zn-finger protein
MEHLEGVMSKACTCGRSATGFCTGLHRLTNEEWDARTFDEAFINEEKQRDESQRDSS